VSLSIKVSARAAAQIQKAAAWWAANRPAAPGAVAADFGEAAALLADSPGIGARYEGSRTPEVRRLFLSRIGYFIYYRTANGSLTILAFWHASRGKGPAV